MKATLIILLLAMLCICHIANAYDKKACDAPPTDTGFGRAYSFKYHYIKTTNQCTSFLWGGQGYTANLFLTEEICKKFCDVK